MPLTTSTQGVPVECSVWTVQEANNLDDGLSITPKAVQTNLCVQAGEHTGQDREDFKVMNSAPAKARPNSSTP